MSVWLPEREIFLRSGGQVRFVRVGTRLQATALALVGAALLAWAGITLFMLARHAQVAIEQAQLAHERAAVDSSSAKLATYRKSAAGIAQELEARQHLIEDLVKTRLGPIAPGGSPAQPAPATAQPQKISDAIPTADQMHALEAGQDVFAHQLATAFDARSVRAANALRSMGLNPNDMLAHARTAQGGPLEALPKQDAATMTPALRELIRSVERFGILEDTLVAAPSGLPTQGEMVTSSYGVRSDPFTGAAAFHAGLDFRGNYGQQIFAAAAGKVAYVGDRSGYGHVVEIDHGNGIMTRYAHLSGFEAKVGQAVTRGQQIARMGSTGRSTGTHLHFEVRLNGAPLNPRRFLEAKQDVFHVQQTASVQPVHGRNRG